MASFKLDKDGRLKRLLEAGMLPAELPPPFVSNDFGRFRQHLKKTWPTSALNKFKSTGEKFSLPRYVRARRQLTIINPVNHFKTSLLIADNWKEIRDFLKTSKNRILNRYLIQPETELSSILISPRLKRTQPQYFLLITQRLSQTSLDIIILFILTRSHGRCMGKPSAKPTYIHQF